MLNLNVMWRELRVVIKIIILHTLKKIKIIFLAVSFAFKFVCVDYYFRNLVVFYRGGNAVYKFIDAILEEYVYCQKVMNEILIKILSCLYKIKKDLNQVKMLDM